MFPAKSYQISMTTSHYRGHSAGVLHSTDFATVYNRVRVSSCLVGFEFKLLRSTFLNKNLRNWSFKAAVAFLCLNLQWLNEAHLTLAWNQNHKGCCLQAEYAKWSHFAERDTFDKYLGHV